MEGYHYIGTWAGPPVILFTTVGWELTQLLATVTPDSIQLNRLLPIPNRGPVEVQTAQVTGWSNDDGIVHGPLSDLPPFLPPPRTPPAPPVS